MYIRPKPGENEEDILRMQEEYKKEQETNKSFLPAASVVNLRPKRQATETPPEKIKVSKYAQAKGLKTTSPKSSVNPMSLVGDVIEKNREESTSSECADKNDDNVYYPSVIPSIIGNIVERNVDYTSNIVVKSMPISGFPSVVKHDTNVDPGIKSIFSQHTNKQEVPLGMCKTSHMDIDDAPAHNTQELTQLHSLNIPSKSYILTSADSDHIHKENVEKLTTMSEQQIFEEQQKLLSSLNPDIISFLKSKRQKSSNTKHTQSTSQCIEKNLQAAGDTQNVDDSLWDNDVLSHPQIHKWLNFNDFEKDKLDWIKGLTDSKINNPEKPYEARFNFEGYLMPYTVEYTERTKTLFHHGDEPHRPGYTLSELFELTRSKVTQQRVMSLNTLAGILDYYMAGVYKDVIDLPLSKLFFVLRFALDENIVTVLEPALKALRNLFYNRTDEASLDALVGFEDGVQQPCLENDKSEIEELDTNESELKDFHLAEIDLVTAAYRTDIIQRIYYILNVLKPSFNCVHYSMQILIRLARDSVNMAHTIIGSEHLMTTIVHNFIPVSDINFSFQPQVAYNKTPVLAALKLIRVLSLQSQEICNILVNKHQVLKSISAYISCSVEGIYGLRIQIEAYCILSNLLQYSCGEDTTMSLFPILATTLYRHVQGTDIFVHSSVWSATHAAVVIQLLTRLYQQVNNVQLQNMKLHLNPLLLEGFKKWFTQISTVEVFTLGHLRLLCSITDCYRNIIQNEPIIVQYIVPSLKTFSTSSGYKSLLSQLLCSSNILSAIEQQHIHTNKNLVNLATSIVDSSLKVLPILNTSSPIPFFVSLFKLLECMNQSSLSDIYARSMWEYLELIKTRTPHLCDNWFTRTEVDFLFSIIKLVCLKKDLNESDKELLYTVSNKLCYILRSDKKHQLDFLFGNIIFNKNLISAERLMKTISLSESNMSVATFPVNEIKSLYVQIINVDNKDTSPNVVLKKWQDPLLPRDWIYLPILNLYSRSQDIVEEPRVIGEHAKKVATQQDLEKTSVICSSLQWIIFNEHCFPDLLTDIDITDKLCRIMCVFLCDNSLFLQDKVKPLLKECIQILFKLEKEYGFNFSKPLTGLSNFQDFYTQFLEQFQSVSYGDSNFASCVLVPLAQKHDVKWRKLVWSEYAGCVRALDCPEQELCYDFKEYLYPEETDMSVLKSYFNALTGNLLRPNTIAYTIAHHHVTSFRNREASVET